MGGANQGIGNCALRRDALRRDRYATERSALRVSRAHHCGHAARFSSNIVENEDGPGPYGAKGVGEGALAGVAAAIATALADAGIHMSELPATPERIWWAMQNGADRRIDGRC